MPCPERMDPYGLLLGSIVHLDGRVVLQLTGELDGSSADGLPKGA